MNNNNSNTKKKKQESWIEWAPDEDENLIEEKVIYPLADLEEEENEIIAKFNLPRVDEKDIIINMFKNMIEVKAEDKKKRVEKGKDFYKEGRSYRRFYRSIVLPEEIIPEKSSTHYARGVLIVHMPKARVHNIVKRRLNVH